MLKSLAREQGGPQGTVKTETDIVELNFEKVFAIARRQWWVVALACMLGLGVGLIYILTTVPLYTARAELILDNRKVQAVETVSGVAAVNTSEASVNSEVGVINSERIGMRVVERLRLHEDETFMNPVTGNFLSTGIALARQFVNSHSWFASDGEIAPGEVDLKRAAFRRLRGGLQIDRNRGTYVIEISYTSPNPGEAARIANAVANAYLTDQLDMRYESTQRASDWLQQRIAELETRSREADHAVQRFRAENNLLAAGGRLISEQQLSEISSQLIQARAETAGAKARLDRIRAIIREGKTDAIVGDALQQVVINTLRANYIDASKQLANVSETRGADQMRANLRNEMKQYERLIFEELRRIEESYLSDYEVARSREESMQQGLDDALGVAETANETLVALRELEGRANTYRTLLEGLQARLEEAMQQQSFPLTDARIITVASVPGSPSHPNTLMALALSLSVSAAFGVAIGLFREYSDRVFRTSAQIRDDLHVEFLGMLPRIDGLVDRFKREDAAALNAARRFAAPPIMRYALDNPLSAFAETLRSAKVAADIALQDEDGCVIAVVSTLPGEGKSTTAINLAVLLASQGKRTLLIDADMRKFGLTRVLCPLAEHGLVDNLLNEMPIDELLLQEPDSGLHFLPCVIKTRIPHTADLLASPAMKSLLREAARTYDYVVVDCPPLNPVVDVRAAAAMFNGFVYVVEWGRTPRAAVRNTMKIEEQVYDRCLGVILNMVDKNRLGAYEEYGSTSYDYGRYSTYYQK